MKIREGLKWLIAGKEMARLERWCWANSQADRWLAGFPAVVKALDHVRGTALGEENYNNIERVRDEIRAMSLVASRPEFEGDQRLLASSADAPQAQAAEQAMPSWIQFDGNDEVTIYGVKYSSELFRNFAGAMPVGCPFKIVTRGNGVLCVVRLSSAADSAQQENRAALENAVAQDVLTERRRQRRQ